MYRDTFSKAQCEEVIRRFEADERKHASTTATRDKPRLRSGTMLQIGDLPEWQDIAEAWSQALEKNLQAYAEAFPTLKQLVSIARHQAHAAAAGEGRAGPGLRPAHRRLGRRHP